MNQQSLLDQTKLSTSENIKQEQEESLSEKSHSVMEKLYQQKISLSRKIHQISTMDSELLKSATIHKMCPVCSNEIAIGEVQADGFVWGFCMCMGVWVFTLHEANFVPWNESLVRNASKTWGGNERQN